MCCWSARIVNVITPPAEVTNVEASAAGATSDGLRPDPIRTGARNAPPPMPWIPPTHPTTAARAVSAGAGISLAGRWRIGASGPGQHQPQAQRDQHGGDHQVED